MHVTVTEAALYSLFESLDYINSSGQTEHDDGGLSSLGYIEKVVE